MTLLTSRTSWVANIDRLDPVSIVLGLHALGLILAGSLDRPSVVGGVTAALILIRIAGGHLARSGGQPRRGWLLGREVGSTLLAGVVVVAEGGTESPLFFWLLILLAWQALVLNRASLTILGGTAVVTYLGIVVAASDVTATSVARLGLFVAFILVLVAGRTLMEHYERRLRRLDATVAAVVADMPFAVAVLDGDRETVLYANAAARAIGIDSKETMAQLVPVGRPRTDHIVTLAEIVEQRAWEHRSMEEFRPIGHPDRRHRIGFDARRLEDGAPIVLLYGEDVTRPSEG